MREGWEVKILKEVTLFKSGKTVSKDIERSFGEVLYTKVGDMNLIGNEENITTSTRFVDLKDINEKQIIPIGSIIFPKRGGAIATNKKRKIVKPTIVDLNTMAITPTKKLLSEYLYYWFESIDLNDLSNGTSIPQINNNSFDNVFISFPKAIEEQKQIVAILDKAFTAIDQAKANIEKNIANAKELFQSKLNDIFSQKGDDFKEENLGSVFTFRQGIQRGVKLQSEQKQDGQVRFIRIIDYTQGKELPRYIDNPGEQYVLTETDISLVRYGASTGFVCRGISGVLANNLFRVIPKDNFKINCDYLYYFLASPVFQRFIKSKMNGAAMPAISFGMVSKILFPITSIENQIKISQKIEEVEEQTDNILEVYYKKIENLEDLKKSILQKAFAGELTSPKGTKYRKEVRSASDSDNINTNQNPERVK
ncbi:restriction endonuclease subunit S [Polaribacter sp. M15]